VVHAKQCLVWLGFSTFFDLFDLLVKNPPVSAPYFWSSLDKSLNKEIKEIKEPVRENKICA